MTADPGGFPSDYIAVAGSPILVFDLGSDTDISTIHTWGYSNGNTNGVSEFSLRFATAAEGDTGFGNSITYNPTFSMLRDESVLQSNDFNQTLNARYVEFTVIDNFFVAPGNGPDAGGDRVGLGEVSFSAVPEPTTGLLGLLGLAFVMRRRR
ncbi:MAG: PEP-CTERM sorting domain-containing protein [Akkermansiaceae bacterium]